MQRIRVDRRLFAHDVELLAPVRSGAGQLGPHLVVTAKMGGAHHLHRALILLRQGEEAGRQP
ncbi:hypothetical protein D3C78_1913500 [compost metagenome]